MTQVEFENQIREWRAQKAEKLQPLEQMISEIKERQVSKKQLLHEINEQYMQTERERQVVAKRMTAIINEYDQRIREFKRENYSNTRELENISEYSLVKELNRRGYKGRLEHAGMDAARIEWINAKLNGKDDLGDILSFADSRQQQLKNGVYIVYKDGRYALYEGNGETLSKEKDMRVGISWNGHKWLVGDDYGEIEWTKLSKEELEANDYGIMKEYEALFDWDINASFRQKPLLWSHIPFKDDETMPTAPMVLVQEYIADVLSDALEFCGLPEYKTEKYRWFAERRNANSARYFGGAGGYTSNLYVNLRGRVQGVALWND